jgi:cytidylate kinase
MSDSMAIAIDGPSASGKTTTAREVAATLGLVHLNSGLLYRAVTWIALRDGWSSDRDFASGLARLRISLAAAPPEVKVRIDGSVPGAWLQASEVNARVSAVAARADVRKHVTEALRAAAEPMSIVMDGRDIGTVVLPEATLKIFLTASPDVRARRRLAERPAEATEDSVSREVSRLAERDRLDATRRIAPLVRADDAVELDTTSLTPQEVVAKIVELYRAKARSTG